MTDAVTTTAAAAEKERSRETEIAAGATGVRETDLLIELEPEWMAGTNSLHGGGMDHHRFQQDTHQCSILVDGAVGSVARRLPILALECHLMPVRIRLPMVQGPQIGEVTAIGVVVVVMAVAGHIHRQGRMAKGSINAIRKGTNRGMEIGGESMNCTR